MYERNAIPSRYPHSTIALFKAAGDNGGLYHGLEYMFLYRNIPKCAVYRMIPKNCAGVEIYSAPIITTSLSLKCPRGPMDKASAYEAGDCRFEPYRGFLKMTCE